MVLYKVMARNVQTGRRIQQQFLNGYRVVDAVEAQRLADDLANKQARRDGERWVGEIAQFTSKC